MVLAAGAGTRMHSKIPKMLHPVGGVPMVHHPLALALQLGTDPVVVVVGPGSEAMEQSISASFAGERVRFALQDRPRGTADAVACGLPALEEATGPVLILSGDVPNLDRAALDELVRAYRESGSSLAFLSFRARDPRGYGRVLRDEGGRVLAIVEHRDARAEQRAIGEVNAGIYAAHPRLLRELLARLDAGNAQGELYLTDMVRLAVRRGLQVPAIEISEETAAGVNDRVQLARAERVWRRRRNEELMLSGVSMEDPGSTFVGAEAELGPDLTLEPGVRITGRSRLASRVWVGTGCVLHDTEVAEGTRIHPYSICEGSCIGPECLVGPFARLRPGTRLGRRVRIGNFVETKKAVLGDGSKASHLSYLGDATLGRDVNVGCGTITCNYDGFAKYQTVVGDGCLIGSDTALVAPVCLGKRVVTGAGSVITTNIPDEALAVTRVRQKIVKDYYQRLSSRYGQRKSEG